MGKSPFSYYTGLGIALSRLIVDSQLLVVSITDPKELGFNAEWDDQFALAYFINSGLALAFSLTEWRWDFTLSKYYSILDYIAIVSLTYIVSPETSGYLACTIALYAFTIISMTIRWNATVSLRVSAMIIVIWIISCYLQFIRYDHFDESLFVRTVSLVMSVSLVVAYFCTQLGQIKCDSLDLWEDRAQASPEAEQVMKYAMRISGAKSAMYQRVDRAQSVQAFGVIRSRDGAGALGKIEEMPKALALMRGVTIFDSAKGRAPR